MEVTGSLFGEPKVGKPTSDHFLRGTRSKILSGRFLFGASELRPLGPALIVMALHVQGRILAASFLYLRLKLRFGPVRGIDLHLVAPLGQLRANPQQRQHVPAVRRAYLVRELRNEK